MLSWLVLFHLQIHPPTCLEMKPYINFALIEKLGYDGDGIPDWAYCTKEDY